MPDTPDRDPDPCCQNCGNSDRTVGRYVDGLYCQGCRHAIGPEPNADEWEDEDEGHFER